MHSLDSSYETIDVRQHSQYVLLITLNRELAANAFNTKMAIELTTVFENLQHDPDLTRAVVLTAAGTRAFCAGADLKERKGMSDEQWHTQHLVFERMIQNILSCPLPIIGAINGAAYGGGCEIAAALDFIYVSESARFAQSEVTLGIIPGIGGTQTLSRAIGEKRSKELIMSGRSFSAQEAFDWGLANAIFPQNELLSAALNTAANIARNAPIAVKQAKYAIQQGMQVDLKRGMEIELSAYKVAIQSADRREGILAFNEKRKPNFSGK